ncbi:MAG: hypothetical protein LBU82_01335 [Treponema sp.]|jgi:hypothetical protein|nr:hypothetical protein [Treponema sp.]
MAGGTINFTVPIGDKSIGGFVIDAFLVETYNFANRLTNLTVEEGSNISDHVVEEPDTIDLEAFIGQTKFETFTGTVETDLSKVELPDDPKSRIRQAYHELLRMKRERQPITVVTGLDTFPDMVITSLNRSRDVETGADIPFTMSFQKIKTVKSEETQISASVFSDGSAIGDQSARTANIGNVGTIKITDENSMKTRYRQLYYSSGGKYPTREEYFEQWHEYP